MAGFGRGITSVAMQIGNIATEQLIQSEFIRGKAEWQQRNDDFFAGLQEDPDWGSYAENYKKDISDRAQKDILAGLKTPGAQNSLKDLMVAEAPGYNKLLKGVIDAKLQEENIRNLWAAIQGTDEIQGFIPQPGADLDVLIQGIADAEAAALGAIQVGTISVEQAEEGIIFSLMKDWPEVALEKIKASSLPPQRKLQLESNAGTIIRNRELEQGRIQQEVWTKTEGEAFNLSQDNKLTPEWIREQFNAGNLSKADRDAYLSMLSRPKEVPLNWDAYDKLSEMVEDYDKEKVTKDEVRLAITKALGKDIPEAVAVRLRGKLDTIDEPDNPMNRSDAKRALEVLSDIETEEMRLARLDDADIEELRDTRLKWLKKKDEFERWIKGQEKLTDTDIQNKIEAMTQVEAEEVARDWLDYILNPIGWESGTVGTKIRGLLRGKPKKGEEDLINMTVEELEAIIKGK